MYVLTVSRVPAVSGQFQPKDLFCCYRFIIIRATCMEEKSTEKRRVDFSYSQVSFASVVMKVFISFIFFGVFWGCVSSSQQGHPGPANYYGNSPNPFGATSEEQQRYLEQERQRRMYQEAGQFTAARNNGIDTPQKEFYQREYRQWNQGKNTFAAGFRLLQWNFDYFLFICEIVPAASMQNYPDSNTRYGTFQQGPPGNSLFSRYLTFCAYLPFANVFSKTFMCMCIRIYFTTGLRKR
jgi:hypothetical protein